MGNTRKEGGEEKEKEKEDYEEKEEEDGGRDKGNKQTSQR